MEKFEIVLDGIAYYCEFDSSKMGSVKIVSDKEGKVYPFEGKGFGEDTIVYTRELVEVFVKICHNGYLSRTPEDKILSAFGTLVSELRAASPEFSEQFLGALEGVLTKTSTPETYYGRFILPELGEGENYRVGFLQSIVHARITKFLPDVAHIQEFLSEFIGQGDFVSFGTAWDINEGDTLHVELKEGADIMKVIQINVTNVTIQDNVAPKFLPFILD